MSRAAHDFVAAARNSSAHVVLAVSGGRDSMVLMHAVADALGRVERSRPHSRPIVVTFDHGTGAQATAAATLVASDAARLGFAVHVGRSERVGTTEADWRAARWKFFRQVAPRGARIATAHTRDDQLETVVMRVLRDARARGIAGMASPSPGVVRPFLDVARADVHRWGNIRGVSFVEDPSNASRAYFRNRVRLDLLPALDRVSPRFGADMLALADRAAELREDVDAVVQGLVSEDVEVGALRVAREQLATYDSATLCVLWPAIAARALVTLDRRGTLRLAQFTTSGAPGARMQLSGGVEVYRHRDSFVLRRVGTRRPFGAETPLVGVVQVGGWLFRPIDSAGNDAWVSDLPADRQLVVRPWRPADRMRARDGGPARRVKRFFGDAKIPGPSRDGWPVVLADDEIVWIPGVCRMVAASERSGRPVVRYLCERFDGGFASS